MGFFFRKRSVQNNPFNASPTQAGNAVVIVLVGIALFGALAGVFMRGSQSGQGNLTDQQAKIAAQELLNFFRSIDTAVSKLRMKGCSQSEINFANSNDQGPFIIFNKTTTAPLDGSCDVFSPNGGGLSFNINLGNYQLSAAAMGGNDDYKGQIKLREGNVKIESLATSAAEEKTIVFDYVLAPVCNAYNKMIGADINQNIYETDTLYFGDENTTIAGNITSCFPRSSSQNKMYYVLMQK